MGIVAVLEVSSCLRRLAPVKFLGLLAQELTFTGKSGRRGQFLCY